MARSETGEKTRNAYLGELRRQHVHKAWAAVALSAYTLLGFLRDDILPYGVEHNWWGKTVQSHLTVLDFLGEFSWRSWLIFALGLLLILSLEAGYKLFHEQNAKIAALLKRATDLEARGAQLVYEIEGVAYGGTIQAFPDQVTATFLVTIRNIGEAASVATGYSVVAEVGGQSFRGEVVMLSGGPITLEMTDGRRPMVLRQEDAVVRKTATPIPAGGMVQGYISSFFKQADVGRFENNPKFTLTLRDVRGRECVAHKAVDSTINSEIMFLPGMSTRG